MSFKYGNGLQAVILSNSNASINTIQKLVNIVNAGTTAASAVISLRWQYDPSSGDWYQEHGQDITELHIYNLQLYVTYMYNETTGTVTVYQETWPLASLYFDFDQIIALT